MLIEVHLLSHALRIIVLLMCPPCFRLSRGSPDGHIATSYRGRIAKSFVTEAHFETWAHSEFERQHSVNPIQCWQGAKEEVWGSEWVGRERENLLSEWESRRNWKEGKREYFSAGSGSWTQKRRERREPSWRRGSRLQAMCRPRAWAWLPRSILKNLNLQILNSHLPLRLLTKNKHTLSPWVKFV